MHLPAVAAAAVVLLAAPLAAADAPGALPAGAVVLGHHDAPTTTLAVVAASADVTLVSQASSAAERYLVGATGDLTVSTQPASWSRVEAIGATLYGLAATPGSAPGDSGSARVSLDPATGATTSDALPAGTQYVMTTAAGWLGLSGGTLTLHGATDRPLATGLAQAGMRVAASGDHALLTATRTGQAESLLLVDLTTGTSEWIDIGGAGVDGLAIGPTTLAWARDGQVVRRAVAGGPTTTYDTGGWFDSLAVTDGAVAWTVWADSATRLVVAPDGGEPARVPLEDIDYRVLAAGPAFRIAVNGSLDVAGVYEVTATGVASRVATVPAPGTVWSGVDLAAGSAFAADGTQRWWGQHLWSRRIVEDGVSLAAGPETDLGRALPPNTPARFSAGRGVVPAGLDENMHDVFTVLDRGRPVASVTDPEGSAGFSPPRPGEISGPYVAVDHRVYLADGRELLGTDWYARPSVFGPLAAWGTGDGTVLLRDLSVPTAGTEPVVLRESACAPATWCPAGVTIGGDSVVWVDATGLTVHDLRGGAERHVPRADGAPWPSKVRADVGAVVWEESLGAGSSIYALDTTDPDAGPVLVASTLWLLDLSLDDGRVAWVTSDGEAVVAPLPFDHPRPPRLLGVVGTAFSPNADGVADTWAPQIDVTKPLTSATLTVSHGGKVVRVLHGTAPDGSIRDIRWDGLDDAGRPVADAVYRWVLTGEAADGDGPVRAVDGVGAASGEVLVERRGPTAWADVPPAVVDGASVRVGWRSTADPATGTESYDVRVRTLAAAPDGVPRPGPARLWRSRTTRHAASYPVRGRPGTSYQFSVRAHDTVGNVGPWSRWASTTVPWDDRALVATGRWTREAEPTAYRGTLTMTTRAGVWLDLPPARGATVRVYGRSCDTCGELQVWVDGVRRGRVDTFGGTDGTPDLLWSGTFPRGRHAVRLLSVRAYGRTAQVVDAVAVGPR